MASKVILDSPELLAENLVTLTAACGLFPVRCSRPAVERWIRRGSRGVVLESILVCGKRFTSREAIDRFVRNQFQTGQEIAASKIARKSKKEIADATKRFRLPEPEQATSE